MSRPASNGTRHTICDSTDNNLHTPHEEPLSLCLIVHPTLSVLCIELMTSSKYYSIYAIAGWGVSVWVAVVSTNISRFATAIHSHLTFMRHPQHRASVTHTHTKHAVKCGGGGGDEAVELQPYPPQRLITYLWPGEQSSSLINTRELGKHTHLSFSRGHLIGHNGHAINTTRTGKGFSQMGMN